jgi:predicted RNA-binding Zn-ribbon protein involved in translation (DUF1610 family)
MAVIKNIIALKDLTINTRLESKKLNAGEVTLLRFQTENEFRAMVGFGNFAEHKGAPPSVIANRLQEQAPIGLNCNKHQENEPMVGIIKEVRVLEGKEEFCEGCGTKMILTVQGNQTLYFCPSCGAEKELEAQEEVEADTPVKVTNKSKAKKQNN